MIHPLKYARLMAGMKQPEVAKALGVTVPTVSNWENGKAIPRMNQAKRLAELYGVTMDALASDLPHLKAS